MQLKAGAHEREPIDAVPEDDFSKQDFLATKNQSKTQAPSEFKLEFTRRKDILVVLVSFHLGALYAVYLAFTSAKLATVIFAYALYRTIMYSLVTGVHRLWSHKSYKATLPLRLILMIFQTMSLQFSLLNWCRDHRLHHKYSDTDADPHNPTRGLFYAHVGWLIYKRHPLAVKKAKTIDVSDLLNDPVVVFQKKYYAPMLYIVGLLIPAAIPVYLWNETWWNAFFLATVLRSVVTWHAVWVINSISHTNGSKPYDKHMRPTDSKFVAIYSCGEGYHNYHHVFPWDYRASEENALFNYSTKIINFFAKIGWAYELKSATSDMMKRRALRTGDGSHEIWGWGDIDQSAEEKLNANIKYKQNTQ